MGDDDGHCLHLDRRAKQLARADQAGVDAAGVHPLDAVGGIGGAGDVRVAGDGGRVEAAAQLDASRPPGQGTAASRAEQYMPIIVLLQLRSWPQYCPTPVA